MFKTNGARFTGSPMTVRRATLRDLDTLVLHRRMMFVDIGKYSDAQLAAADVVYRRWARARLRSGALAAWIVREKGASVASGALWFQPIQPRPDWPRGMQPYLLSMYTAPSARGKGHASRIVKAAISFAKKEGYPRMSLHASQFGRPLYEKLGFEATPEMKLTLSRPTSRASRTRSGSRS